MVVTSPLLFPVPPQIHRAKTPTATAIQTSQQSMAEEQRKKRVLVCGGGVIGVCTAYFLAEKGAAVTLLEQSSVACAASGKSGGFLALDWCDGGPLSALARASFDLHRQLAHKLDGPHSYGYRPLTTVSLSLTEQPFSRTVDPTRPLPSWVDGPASNPRVIGTTETTAQVHPGLFTKAVLARAVGEYGVEVVEGGMVKGVEVEGGMVKGVTVEEGGGRRVVGGDAVVLAMGPWSGKFEMLSSIFRVYGLKAHSVVLEPRDPSAISAHALFLSYCPAGGGKALDPEVYPRPTGEVYVCGMSAEEEVPDDPEQVVGNPDSIAMLKRVAKTVSSHLAEEATVKVEQACFLPCTADSVPIIGEVPGMKGCYVATGHSCWGILNGPATGAAVAELVVDGEASIVDLSPFSPARFTRGRKR